MIKLSDAAKQKYAKYVGPDGKLIIDDSLPDDIKEAFKYFNDRNINILELNVDDNIDNIEDEEEEDVNIDDDIIDSSYSNMESESYFDDNIVEEENASVDDLDDIF